MYRRKQYIQNMQCIDMITHCMYVIIYTYRLMYSSTDNEQAY